MDRIWRRARNFQQNYLHISWEVVAKIRSYPIIMTRWLGSLRSWNYVNIALHVVMGNLDSSLRALLNFCDKLFWCYLLLPLRVFWIIIANIQACLATSLYHILARPLLYFSPDLYWVFSGYFHIGIQIYVASFARIAGFQVSTVGADMRHHGAERCLLLPNHQAFVDASILSWSMLQSPGGAHSAMWIFSAVFRKSHYGITSILQGDYPIAEGKSQEERDKEQRKLTEFNWIFLFPEGGFLHKRKAKSQEFAKRHNYPVLEHVALPRVGGTKAVLDALSPKTSFWTQQEHMIPNRCIGEKAPAPLAWIVDVTIAYPGGRVAPLWDLLTARLPQHPVILAYRMFSADQVPTDRSHLTDWLNDRFVEKDFMLSEYYKTGKFSLVFPDDSEENASCNRVIDTEIIPCPPVSVLQIAVAFFAYTLALVVELGMIYRLFHVLMLVPSIIVTILSVM